MDNAMILISHDNSDEKIAVEIKTFLEEVFLNAHVFVAGRDLMGGQIWINELKKNLKSSQVIISLLTPKSLENKWVYFESGAGFTDEKTIPLLTENLKPENLTPPMSLLQARPLSEQGFIALIKDISKKFNQREPKIFTGIKDLIKRTDKILRIKTALRLQTILPKNKIAPNATRQWIYEGYCLVHDYSIENRDIAVDTVFNIDNTEIQLFDRSGTDEYLFGKMGKTPDFLPLTLNQYDKIGNRLIFKKFESIEKIETIADSLTDLLNRIEIYKKNIENN